MTSSRERRIELWAGIFIAAGLLILVFGIGWLRQIPFVKRTYPVLVSFSDTGGLRIGDPVDIAGVKKGKVARVQLRPHDVLVTLEVDKDVFLAEDCRVSMRNLSLLSGEKYVKIELGRSPKAQDPKVPFQGSYYDEYAISGITEALKHLNSILGGIDIPQVAELINGEINKLSGELEASLKPVAQSEAQISRTIANLERVTAGLDTATVMLRSRQGTLGVLLNDRQAYDELIATNRELRALIADIKQNPGRYIRVRL